MTSRPPDGLDQSQGVAAPAAGATHAFAGTASHLHQPDKVGVRAESIRGAVHVGGDQTNNFNCVFAQEGSATATPWEDELIAVSRLPEPGRPVDADEVERRVVELQASRLLLLRHDASRQRDAEAAMHSTLQALRCRESERKTFVNSFDAVVPLNRLARGAWREDRRGIVLYLYRSDDPGVLDFFSSIEQVDLLCTQLAAMDCYLLLTVATSGTGELRCEHELDRHIAVWSFASQQPPDNQHYDQLFSGHFDLTLISCAALFPGLSADEFIAVTKLLLAPSVAQSYSRASTTAADTMPGGTTAPLGRRERWWQNEKSSVLAELGLWLQRPPQAREVGGEGAQAGVFINDAVRLAELPSWLYERHAFMLAEYLPALTTYYLMPHTSRRFAIGYCRLVHHLDAIGVCPLSAEWLTHQLQAAFSAPAPDTAIQRFHELLAALPELNANEELLRRFIAGVRDLIIAHEASLHDLLRERDATPDGRAFAEYPFGIWHALYATHAAQAPIEQSVARQAVLFDLLLTHLHDAPDTVVRAVADAVNECNAVHRRWLRAHGHVSHHASLSLARMVCRARLTLLARHEPHYWLAMTDAVTQAGVDVLRGRTGHPHGVSSAEAQAVAERRWLAWECLHALGALLGNIPDLPWPDALYDGLIGVDGGSHLGKVLALLLMATRDDARDEWVVDADASLWIYHSLAQAAILRKPDELAYPDQVVTALIGPLCAAFTSSGRMALVSLAIGMLSADSTLRAQAVKHGERELISRRMRALNSVVRALRSPPQ